jgi:hypothetical protein
MRSGGRSPVGMSLLRARAPAPALPPPGVLRKHSLKLALLLASGLQCLTSMVQEGHVLTTPPVDWFAQGRFHPNHDRAADIAISPGWVGSSDPIRRHA